MTKRMDTEEGARRKRAFAHYLEEIILLGATVGAILVADAIQKFMRDGHVANTDIRLNIANIAISSFLALVVYGKRYSNFKEIGKTKPPFLLRLSDAIIYGIGFKGIVGISTNAQ